MDISQFTDDPEYKAFQQILPLIEMALVALDNAGIEYFMAFRYGNRHPSLHSFATKLRPETSQLMKALAVIQQQMTQPDPVSATEEEAGEQNPATTGETD